MWLLFNHENKLFSFSVYCILYQWCALCVGVQFIWNDCTDPATNWYWSTAYSYQSLASAKHVRVLSCSCMFLTPEILYYFKKVSSFKVLSVVNKIVLWNSVVPQLYLLTVPCSIDSKHCISTASLTVCLSHACP